MNPDSSPDWSCSTFWRAQLDDDTGARLNPRPTVYGPMSAIVVGPNGETEPNGADGLWCDAMGRVKLRFHWQRAESPGDRDSCWVRVLSRQAGKAGIAHITGQHLQYANGETTTFASGQDTNLAIAGKARVHSGQAIGLLAGAIRPGEGNTGLKLIAAKDDLDLQAQSDELKLQAKKDLKLVSATQHIDFAAAKKIHLAVEGGASITIDGNIIVQCPGTITVHASKKSFSGPTSQNAQLPTFPSNVCVSCLLAAAKSGAPFSPKA